jgi:NAD dependent epimerase/dehydratase family enzyme
MWGNVMTYLTQSRKLIAKAQKQVRLSRKVTTNFLIADLEQVRALAKVALNAFATGNRQTARLTSAMAKEGYDSVRNFLARVKDEARKPIEARLATLDPLIGQLAAIS